MNAAQAERRGFTDAMQLFERVANDSPTKEDLVRQFRLLASCHLNPLKALAMSVAHFQSPETVCHDCGSKIAQGQCRIEVKEGVICQTCYQDVEWPEVEA